MHISSGIKRVAGMLAGGLLVILSMGVHSDSAVIPGSKAASMDACVAPTPEMRRNHMDYLKHDRNQTVHQGIRDIKYSLSGCVDCHAGRDGRGMFAPVDDEKQFCAGCHSYMAVKLTCFQCHRNIPEGAGPAVAAAEYESPETVQMLEIFLEKGAGSMPTDELTQRHADSRGD